MSYTQQHKILLKSIDYDEISKAISTYCYKLFSSDINDCLESAGKSEHKYSLETSNTTIASIHSQSYSYIKSPQSELGLTNYYTKHPDHFLERLIKGPPDVYRKYAWMIAANVPNTRKALYYWNLLKSKELDINIQAQINKDVSRSIKDEGLDKKLIGINVHLKFYEPLSRLLKAIAILDRELSYCQGMNFISVFLLCELPYISEIDAFYLLMALFSNTFNHKYSVRGFYIEHFPL